VLQSDYFIFLKDDLLHTVSSVPHILSYIGPSLGRSQVLDSERCTFALCSRHGCTVFILLALPFGFSLPSCLIFYTICLLKLSTIIQGLLGFCCFRKNTETQYITVTVPESVFN